MDNRRLKAACEERLATLRLPYRFGTQQLLNAVGDLRGTPVRVQPFPYDVPPGALCGVRLDADGTHVLLVEPRTLAGHQLHIVAHEVGHLLWDHPDPLVLSLAEFTFLSTHPDHLRRRARRTRYSAPIEREAEMMATVIRQRIWRERHLPCPNPSTADERWEALFAQSRTAS